MSLLLHGNNTLISDEVTSITKLGFWILIDNIEYFVPFTDYPDFKKARVEDILDFKKLLPNQLYWEKLDIDIELEALKNPENYPLIFS